MCCKGSKYNINSKGPKTEPCGTPKERDAEEGLNLEDRSVMLYVHLVEILRHLDPWKYLGRLYTHSGYPFQFNFQHFLFLPVTVLEPAINIRKSWKGFPIQITAAVSVPSLLEPEGYKYVVFSRCKFSLDTNFYFKQTMLLFQNVETT